MESTDIVKVTILGNTYRLQAGDDPGHVERVVDYVKGKLDEISTAVPDYSQTQLAILTAINIADEYLKSSSSGSNEEESEVKEKVRSIIEKIPEISEVSEGKLF